GTFVSGEPVRGRTAPRGVVRPSPVWASMPEPTPWTGPVPYDIRVGVPEPGLFRVVTWRRLVAGELRRAPAGYGDPSGHEGLREAIARHIGISRSVRASAADVLITTGAQQALDLV